MRKPKQQTNVISPVGSLDTENTFAGAIIGDNWVVMVIAHADPMGMVFPLRARRAFFEVAEGESPNPNAVGNALEECWNGLGGGAAFEYSKFLLCLPARATHSRQSEAWISTHPTGPFRFEHSIVTSQHLRQLQNKISRDGFWPRYAVCDLVPLTFGLDDRRTTEDPVGRQAEQMSMQAHLVLAEHETVRGILDGLRSLDITVDAILSPHAAAAAILSAEERNARTIAIDIDRLTTTCAFFKDDRMVHSEWVEGGSYTVLEGAAQRLNKQPEELALWLNERDDLVQPDGPDDNMVLPLYPRWRKGVASLVDLDQAARKASSGIVTQLQAVIETAASRLGLAPQRAVLTGDDSLTLRAMMSSLYQEGLICEWRNPRDGHVGREGFFAMPGMARFVGMMRRAHSLPRRQPYLEDYNEIFVDRISARLHTGLPGAVQRLIRSPKASRGNKDAPPPPPEKGEHETQERPSLRLASSFRNPLF